MEEDMKELHPGEKGFTLVLTVFSIFVLIVSYRISGFDSVSSPGTFPMIAGTTMFLTSLFLLIRNNTNNNHESTTIKEALQLAIKIVFRPIVLIFSGIIIVYMMLIGNLNFLLSSFIFLLVSILYLKGAGLVKAVFISAVTIAFIQLVFHYFFEIVLP